LEEGIPPAELLVGTGISEAIDEYPLKGTANIILAVPLFVPTPPPAPACCDIIRL
jgi:hypothetical protein